LRNQPNLHSGFRGSLSNIPLIEIILMLESDERTDVMNAVLNQHEEEAELYQVSDEALEAVAGTGLENAGHFTQGDCTGFVTCPSW